jgi:hypothetical protein
VKRPPDKPVHAIRQLSDPAEIQQAEELMRQIALDRHGCLPPKTSPILFGAISEGRVVGTIGIEFGETERPLSLETIYDFDRTGSPWPFARERIVQIGRWFASQRGISVPLMYTANAYALRNGKTNGFAEMKPRIEQIARDLGMDIRQIPGAKLILDRISPDGMRYYTEPPPPTLYMTDVIQTERAFREETLRLIKELSLDWQVESP